MKPGFLDKLIERLDRIDPKSLHTHFLHLAQERGLLETIFQSIQEGVIVIDERGKLNYANRAAERLMGFNTEQVRGRPVTNFLHDIDWDRILAFDENEWAELISREIEITYPEHKFLAFYVVPLAADTRGEKGAVIILRDITRDRRNEASMVESERLNAVKLLAAGVAHEIGNPLNALNIHLQLLRREISKLEDPRREDLGNLVEIARNEVSRLDVIINQFLRAIRPAKPTLTLQQIDTVLNDTLALLKHDIENRRIRVEVICEETPPRIQVDKDQLKQAFFNIIKNGLQAMPDGGLFTITLGTDDRFVKLAFRDSGIGIPPENFGHIFEPYFTSKSEGSGLGLMIVQRIIQDHGGLIDVTSRPNAGTTFTILLPLAERRIRLLPRAPIEAEASTQPPSGRTSP